MQNDEFPSCCGIRIIHGFGYSGIDRRELSRYECWAEDESPLAVATTASDQTLAAKTLKDAGWVPVFRFYNTNSGNDVTFWVKNLKHRELEFLPVRDSE